ncbi:MAG TPA: hypothetical protein VNJ71_06725 [Gemmatimonadales bacterium]|jgi:hypothetical protein|nr:hypothetical protein [Gemmatimonadales bacterium]
MFGWITAGLIVVAGFAGFVLARGFVRRRLRFVDAIYSPAAPWVAGALAALVAWPVSLLPLITTTTTAVFGIGAGFGTASGVKALRSGER